MKNNKRGISLIVLVITIIVIIILAAAVILTLTGNNPIENAKQAAYTNDLSSFKDELDMYKANEYAKKLGDFDLTELDAIGIAMYSYIPSMTDKTKYTEELAIVDGQLIYIGPTDSPRKTWAAMVNILEDVVPIPPDIIAPTVEFETNGSTLESGAMTKVNVTDEGGLNESTLEYVWDTQNTVAPISGWKLFVNGENIKKVDDGIYYLWIKAKDNANNEIVAKSNAFTATLNVAVGKPTFNSGYYPPSVSTNAVDGISTTAWNAGDYTGWITIDLLVKQSLSGIKILTGSSSAIATSYNIYGSNDNSTWTLLGTDTSSPASTNISGVFKSTNISGEYRYVKVQSVSWPGSWVCICEIKIY